MFQYRQVLVRLRRGDSERDIARARLMGRHKARQLRAVALERGWLEAGAALPEDAEIAAAVGAVRRARSTISSVEPHRAIVERWVAQGVSGVAIYAASPLMDRLFRLIVGVQYDAKRADTLNTPLVLGGSNGLRAYQIGEFLGTTAVLGDYAAGSNHVLPTGRLARGTGGLGLEAFLKPVQFVRATAAGVAAVRGTVEALAALEGLPLHAQAVTVRA